MATVRNTITLKDQMSPVLKAITRSLNSTIDALASVDNISEETFNQARQDAINATRAIEQLGNQTEQLAAPTESARKGFSGWQAAIVTANQLLQLTERAVQTISNGLNTLSDMTDTQSRLKRMAGEEMDIYELQEMIAQTADETRTSYEATAASAMSMYNSLSAAGISQQQAVRLSAILNKQLAASGVKGAALESVMYQLGQSFQSGTIRYEDWKLIQANAGAMVDSIANAAGVTRKELNQMITDGKLSASQFAQLLWETGAEIDQVYADMPDTFADQMERMKTVAYSAIMGEGGIGQIVSDALNSDEWNTALDHISESITRFSEWGALQIQKITNAFSDPSMQQGITSVANTIRSLATVLGLVVGLAVNFALIITENWSWISPIIWGIVAAIAAYNTIMLISKGIQLAKNIATGVGIVLEAAHAGMALADAIACQTQAEATKNAAVNQWLLNSALLASPITWIIIAVIALIALIYVIVAAINKATGQSISALGVIVGALAVAGAVIWNIIVGVINAIIQFLWTYFVEPWIGIIEWVLNVFNGGFNSFGDAVKNLLGQIISWFLSLGKVVTKIIDAIFGTNWTAGLDSLQQNVLGWGKNENAITLDRNAPEIGRIEYGAAWDAGYSAGETADNWIGDKLGGIGDMLDGVSDATDAAAMNTSDQLDLMKGEDGGVSVNGDVTIDDESIKLIKDVAAAEWVNKYTTLRPEMTVTFGDVHETADADELLDKMETMIAEAYASALTS